MNVDPTLKRQPRNIIAIAAATATLALAGCGEKSEPTSAPEQQGATVANTTTTAPTTTAEQQAQECSGHLVSPKKYFNEANESNLQEDLDLLTRINSTFEKAGFKDIATATGIIYDSYNDPQYAEAIVTANKSITGKNLDTPTVEQFLESNVTDVPKCDGREDKTTKDVVKQQRSNTATIGKVLVAGLSKKYASQGSDLAERGIQKVDQKLDQLVENLR